jgi:hypothetical protein
MEADERLVQLLVARGFTLNPPSTWDSVPGVGGSNMSHDYTLFIIEGANGCSSRCMDGCAQDFEALVSKYEAHEGFASDL